MPGEGQRFLVLAQIVRVEQAARQNESVIIGRVGLVEALVDSIGVAPVGLGPGANAFLAGSDDVHRGTGLLHGFPGLRKLGLLEAVGGEDSDLFTVELLTHSYLLAPCGHESGDRPTPVDWAWSGLAGYLRGDP